MGEPAIGLLWPRPQRLTATGEVFHLPQRPRIAAPAAPVTALARLVQALAAIGCAPHSTPADSSAADFHLHFDPHAAASPEGYRLTIGARGVEVVAPGEAGLYYGVATLCQWLEIHRPEPGDALVPLPGLAVDDAPDFPHRGVLLDVSRNKVPTLATLEALVDLLAGWKINQLQLYTEHTFAYQGHEAVWQGYDPLTPDDVRRLDAFCRARFVELVPNQNSFGHFHRWLVHAPYRRLAECPEGIDHPFSLEREPFSLCPLDPGSLELLADLYDQLLPAFTSRQLNAGLDETLDLGLCRSAEACTERGKGRVYLDFVRAVHGLAAARGRRLQLWGDVILQHPELIPELPRDVVALEWGYEADHPFAADTERFAASGLEFYVCPGTSSWNSFAGRWHNALANLAAATRHGKKAGASGVLVTDWGDHGHVQPLPVSYPGLLAGAGFTWNVKSAESALDLPFARLLDLHAFQMEGLGRVVLELGDAYRRTGATQAVNGSALFFLLFLAHKPVAERRCAGVTPMHLAATRAAVDAAVAELPSGAGLVGQELQWVGAVLGLACDLGSRRLAGEDAVPLCLEAGERRQLATAFDDLVEELRRVWLARNRPGGLPASVARLRRVQELFLGR